jgi:hypothetical protein
VEFCSELVVVLGTCADSRRGVGFSFATDLIRGEEPFDDHAAIGVDDPRISATGVSGKRDAVRWPSMLRCWS